MGSSLKLIIAILLGLFAAIIVVTYLQSKEAEYLGQGPQVKLVIAKRDIAEGDRLSPEMLGTATVPDRISVKQPGAFDEAEMDEVIGKYALVPIKLNEQVVKTKLVDSPEQSLSTIMKTWPGTRTVTISTGGDTNNVASMLRPGDVVDIIGLFNYNVGGRRVEEIRYFEQALRIVALGQETGYGVRKKEYDNQGEEKTNLSYSTVTFAVEPERALRLILGSRLGTFYLTLRPADDEGAVVARENLDAQKILGNTNPIWREADERQQFLPPELFSGLQRANP